MFLLTTTKNAQREDSLSGAMQPNPTAKQQILAFWSLYYDLDIFVLTN